MKTTHTLPFTVAMASMALAAAAAPVVPGEFTDPTNLRRIAEEREGAWYVAPDHLRFPYIATYYVEPTVTTKQRVSIPFYVTDWDHSKVRFLDDSFRFTVRCKWIGPDGKAHETERRGVPSGDGAFDLVLAANAVRSAAERLGAAVGATYSADLLDRLFSRFCVGK